MLTKHQLRVVGDRRVVADFIRKIGGPFPTHDLWLVPDEFDVMAQSEEFALDLSAVAPLDPLSVGAQVIAALDDNNHVLRKLREARWGVSLLPRAHMMKIWGSSEIAGAIVSFHCPCDGTLTPFVRAIAAAYPSLTFRLLWVRWPLSVATNAGAFFPDSDNVLLCPRSGEVESFVRSLGWLGDHGFNESFYYRAPGADGMFSVNSPS